MTGDAAVRPCIESAEAYASVTGATERQVSDLERFRTLLEQWSRRMNLVGPSAGTEFWLRHAFDSAQLLHVEQSALRWVDVGSGAGFPGIILAILLKGREGARIHLVESMAKRVGFLSHVTATLSLPAEVHHLRAEAYPRPPGLEVVTARACAPFPRLFEYTAHLLRGGVTGLFLKGRRVETELLSARTDWTFSSHLIPSRSDPDGRIVRIESLKSRG